MILLNGNRIDGTVGDALPIGSLSPFVGLVAPKGYLICMGQLVDKAKYPELYEICGNTFGTATATQFYLPDLRGVTIAGYKQGDSMFGTLGALIGSITSTTQNHTLTANEIPTHSHGISAVSNNHIFNGTSTWDTGANNRTYKQSSMTYGSAPDHNGTSLLTAYEYSGTNGGYWVADTGGGGAHNHGDVSTIQPTAVMNWIIKASMLAVVTGNIEDSLTSTSSTDALSANQGKVLNDIKINISDIVDNCTTNDASKVLSAKQGKVLNDKFGNYVLTSSIVNNLTSTSTNVPLSAAQGKVLNDKLTNLSSTTLTASSKITSPSYYMGQYQVFGVKAWAYVKVSGTTPTLVAGGNISSVVRTQTGTYRFTFTKAMPNANYAAVASAECGGVGHEIIGVYQHTTTSVIVDVTDVTPALNDPEEINLIVVG